MYLYESNIAQEITAVEVKMIIQWIWNAWGKLVVREYTHPLYIRTGIVAGRANEQIPYFEICYSHNNPKGICEVSISTMAKQVAGPTVQIWNETGKTQEKPPALTIYCAPAADEKILESDVRDSISKMNSFEKYPDTRRASAVTFGQENFKNVGLDVFLKALGDGKKNFLKITKDEYGVNRTLHTFTVNDIRLEEAQIRYAC